MFVVTVEFLIHEAWSKAFEARVLKQARDSLTKEPKCKVFDVCVDPGQLNRFYLYEVYEDQAAFTNHLLSEHFLAFDDACRNWVLEKQVNTFTRLSGEPLNIR